MSIYQYKKYKIQLRADSEKTQGLQTGDIIRRQYTDGTSSIYSLMCVLSYGKDTTEQGEQPYFIGALLEGDVPKSDEILDFVRITNLFNVDRSGALYLTSSNSDAPYMDVIDQLGKNASLSWPEMLSTDDYEDASSQYVISGRENFLLSYSATNIEGNHRILTATRTQEAGDGFEGMQQDFYQLIANPQRVVVSFKAKATESFDAPVSLGYINNARYDARWVESISTEWEYKFKVVTIEYSGRHLRTFKLSLENLRRDKEVCISDFNIILLSSLSDFSDESTMRIGKLDGIVDSVFGKLEGYGAYLQKLYATSGAHVSGTITAGDENGFGGTFYAGKIHRNCFINSTDITFSDTIHIDTGDVPNPTGMGHVYRSQYSETMYAQTNAWLLQHANERYCLSMWIYAKQTCRFNVKQNEYSVGIIQVDNTRTHQWYRVHTCFNILIPEDNTEDLFITIEPSFAPSENGIITDSDGNMVESNVDEQIYYLSAPQLEKGDTVSQYQATDGVLNYTDDYGAWFARGGIGGTIQNPLLKLNYDGKGSIGTRNGSMELKQDGSGHVAQNNISWDENGEVTFSDKVTLNWNNLSKEAQSEISPRYVSIQGEDTFVICLNAEDGEMYNPSYITLLASEIGFSSTSSQRKWYYKKGEEHVVLRDSNGDEENGVLLKISPDDYYWGNEASITFKYEVAIDNNRIYHDTQTITKQYIQGYTVQIVSSEGDTFKNGVISTTLKANVYYQGRLVDEDYVLSHFDFVWRRYNSNNRTEEIDLDATDGETENIIIINHTITAGEVYTCALVTSDGFDYTFPIVL